MTIKHSHNHERRLCKAILNDDDRLRICELFEQGLAPFQILDILRNKTQKKLLYSRKYNAWMHVTHAKFERDNDPLILATQFAKESSNFEIVFHSNEPFALGFTTDMGRRLCAEHHVKEIFIY